MNAIVEMPSSEEQLIAERYVLERIIERPDTDAKKAIEYILGYLFAAFLITWAVLGLFGCFHRYGGLFASLAEWKTAYPRASFFICFCGVCLVLGVACLKAALIGSVRLYQHYAPERIRRKCLFKPTCSEYAILALEKYGVVIGLVKTYERLFIKCRGNIYMIDYP